MELEEIGRGRFDAAELMRDHPPRFELESKRRLFKAIPVPVGGTLTVSRWGGSLPTTVDSPAATVIEVVNEHFTYATDSAEATRWHVNFADRHLFGFYGSSLMAQDEIQCMEHPVLGSLREAILAQEADGSGLAPRTRDERGPTPILISGAQRSMEIDTGHGLYGNAFAGAPYEKVLGATTFIEPPTFSNIVAMVARKATGRIGATRSRTSSPRPSSDSGPAGWNPARPVRSFILATGARVPLAGTGCSWPCCKLIAARMAGLDRLVFHSRGGSQHLADAEQLLDELPLGDGSSVDNLVDSVHAQGFTWGRSDGN